MIGDKFTINGKTYTIKKELKLGEYRKMSNVNARLNRLNKNMIDSNTLEQSAEFSEATNDQLQSICDFLESHVGITQEEIDDIGMNEGIKIFQEAFKLSTTVDTDIKKT